MALSSVTRLPGGIGNMPVDHALADLREPFDGAYTTFFDDFVPYVAANYTVTAGGGAVAQVTGGAGGRITIINAAGAETAIQPAILPFDLSLAKDLFFSTRLMIDDATLSAFFVGLTAADTSPYVSSPTDGIFVKKTAGTVNPSATLRVGGVDIATGALGAMVAGQMYDVGFAYTPQDGALRAFAAGAVRLIPSTLPVSATPLSANISGFGAAARTLTVDYVAAYQGR